MIRSLLTLLRRNARSAEPARDEPLPDEPPPAAEPFEPTAEDLAWWHEQTRRA